MAGMTKLRVAVLVTDGFEEAELTEPARALRKAGATVTVIAPHGGGVQGFRHHDKSNSVDVDMTLDEAQAHNFDALMLPGGALNADAMRVEPKAQAFIRAIQESGKPIAAICHAPWELVSAGLRGRKLTSYHTIQDDIRSAGGHWIDEEVVVDRNRGNREMLALFHKLEATTAPVLSSQSSP